MQIFDDIRVDNNTYITVKQQEIALEDVHKHSGYWLCGFDRDGTCFEMYKTQRDSFAVKQILQDADVEVYEHDNCTYYWTENAHDSSILFVH